MGRLPPTLLQAGRKLMSPSQHLWIRAKEMAQHHDGRNNSSSELTATTPEYVLELGITERGMEDIGDVTSIVLLQQQQQGFQGFARKGVDLLQVHWEGHSITAADELYHTVWDTVEETTTFRAPVSGTLLNQETMKVLSTQQQQQNIDTDQHLICMIVSQPALFSALSNLVCETSYNSVVQKLPPGRFADEHDSTPTDLPLRA